MTSAEIVVEFVRGRPELEQEIRSIVSRPFMAPEVSLSLVVEAVMGAFRRVNAAERAALDRMRGNGSVRWEDVAAAFRSALKEEG